MVFNFLVSLGVPAGFGEGITPDDRLARLLELGELLPKIFATDLDFAKKSKQHMGATMLFQSPPFW